MEDTLRRLVTVFVSGALILLCLPIFLIVAFAIWAADRGPVFYSQTRAGLHNRPFQLFKFRSMRINNLSLRDTSYASEIRKGHPLVTPIGRWIRRYKIDELPQLVNVFLGHMALIGPRPTVPEQTESYSIYEQRRLNVLPGMTGWTQINGGIELTWPERIKLDVWYVDHRSFWLDSRILWQTAAVVLTGDTYNPQALNEAIVYARQQYAETEGASEPAAQASDSSFRQRL